MKSYKEMLLDKIKDDLTTIAVFMQTTMGYPFETFEMKMEEMNLLNQLQFCIEQRKKHPKLFTSIGYKEFNKLYL